MRKMLAAMVGLALLGAPMVASAHPRFEGGWRRPVVLAPRYVPGPVVVGPAYYGPRVGIERGFVPHYRHFEGRRAFGRGWRR